MIGRFVLVSALVLVLGMLFFLVSWDIPAPTRSVEIVIPNDQLPQ